MHIMRQRCLSIIGIFIASAVLIMGSTETLYASPSSAINADTTPPAMGGSNPENGETSVLHTTNIVVQVTDDDTGVNPDTFVMTVNGVQADFGLITYTGVSTDTVFTYNPPVHFSFSISITVEIEATDFAGNAMGPQSYSFQIMDEDTTPPVISNIQCVPSSTNMTISWDTDELARSTVDYGETDALGLSVSKALPVTTRTMEISGLNPSTIYHYQVSSADRLDNEAQSEILTCTTIDAPSLRSDDFNTCGLNDFWTYVDPVGDVPMTANGTQVVFEVPAGTNHDVWSTGNDSARIMQPANDTLFEIEALFETSLDEKNQMQGMIVEADADSYLRINFRRANNSTFIEAYWLDGGSAPVELVSRGLGTIDGEMYIRLWRETANEWKLFYAIDGDTLQPGGYPFTQAMNVTKAGVFAGNAGGSAAPALTSVVDYFFLHNNPITPEDGVALSVGTAVSPVSSGTVSKSNACGNPAELTAEPMPGWRFDNWTSLQGSVMTATNPVEFTYPFDEVVTANFVKAYYSVTTTVEDGADGLGGTVTVSDPANSAGYELGETASITAVAADGWQFDGWSGDVSSTDAALSIEMAADLDLIANFSRIAYVINSSATGNGVIVIDPEGGPYYYGDTVAFEAQAEPGWSFVTWGGALEGSDVSQELVVDEDKAVTALFSQDEYTLTVDSAGTGIGFIIISPTLESYIYGDVVSLTAAPDAGSSFAGWSGAGLSGTDATVSVTMEQSEAVVAEFSRDLYTVMAGSTVGGSIVLSSPGQDGGYVYNELVTVSAVPESGYTFQSWTGDLFGSITPALLTVTGTRTVGAVFAPIDSGTTTYELTVSASEGGSVFAASEGGTVLPNGTYTYEEGTAVSLVAVVQDAESFAFVSWTDESDAVLSTAESYQVTMNSNVTVKANFEVVEAGEFTLMSNVVGNGSIVAVPSSASYPAGTVLALTANADLGWSFDSWSGAVTGDQADASLTIEANSAVTATFTQNIYSLLVSASGEGSVAISDPLDSAGYVYGEQATLNAVASDGWKFVSWEKTEDGTTITLSPAVATPVVDVTGDAVFTATFAEDADSGEVVTGVAVQAVGQGDVMMSPQKEEYAADEIITLTALTQPGWEFVGWESNIALESGAASDTTITVKATAGMEVKAIFEETDSGGTATRIFLPMINP